MKNFDISFVSVVVLCIFIVEATKEIALAYIK